MAILLPITDAEMTRFHEHFYIYLLILVGGDSIQIDVTGELSFGMRISDFEAPFERANDEFDKINLKLKKPNFEIKGNDEDVSEQEETDEDVDEEVSSDRMDDGVTAAPIVECLYQYPDKEQFKAMLSNMMNELIKLYNRIDKLLRKRDSRRHGTRFRVVQKKNTDFFEDIYANMTKEYSNFYNNTTNRVSRAVQDPCNNQEVLKTVWKELLENSLDGVRRASLMCFEEILRVTNREDDSKTRNKLNEYLSREMFRIRTRQLHMLCDSFQLCYYELL